MPQLVVHLERQPGLLLLPDPVGRERRANPFLQPGVREQVLGQ